MISRMVLEYVLDYIAVGSLVILGIEIVLDCFR